MYCLIQINYIKQYFKLVLISKVNMSSELREISNQEDFDKELSHNVASDTYNLRFVQCKFTFEVFVDKNLNLIELYDCIFEERVTFSSICNSEAIFNGSVFNKKVDFSDYWFEGKVRMQETTFNDIVIFNNTVFRDLVDFWGSTFHKKTIFYKTDFFGNAVFSSTKFIENVLFTYSLIDKVLILRSSIFCKGLDISLMVLNGTISLFDLKLSNFKSSEDPTKEADYDDMVAFDGKIPTKNKEETFRLIKNQLQKNGNQFDALKYLGYETTTYKYRLKKEIRSKINLNSNLADYLILFFNSLSNKNGLSWLRGIVFTLSVGIIFYYLSAISTEKYSFGGFSFELIEQNIKHYFQFLLPTHRVDYLQELNPSPAFYFWDFIGRIFVSYGFYQTIQAFRKFKSK